MAADLTEQLRDELGSGARTIPTGPMGVGDEREYELPPYDVESYDVVDAALGEITVYEVELAIDVDTYRFLNDTDNPNQVSPAEAVYDAMEAVGIERPDGTPELGVQLGSVGFEEDEDGTPVPVADKDHVTVQGYVSNGGGVPQTDGGLGITVVETGLTLSAFLAGLAGIGAVGMARILTDIGEEYTVKNSLTTSFDVGVYDDAAAGATGDSISDTDNLVAITTEPGTGNYVRQTETFVTADISGNWGTWTDTDTVFDMTNTSGTADSWFTEINFASTDAGTTADHLLCTGALSQEYDLSNLTQLTITANGVGWTVN